MLLSKNHDITLSFPTHRLTSLFPVFLYYCCTIWGIPTIICDQTRLSPAISFTPACKCFDRLLCQFCCGGQVILIGTQLALHGDTFIFWCDISRHVTYQSVVVSLLCETALSIHFPSYIHACSDSDCHVFKFTASQHHFVLDCMYHVSNCNVAEILKRSSPLIRKLEIKRNRCKTWQILHLKYDTILSPWTLLCTYDAKRKEWFCKMMENKVTTETETRRRVSEWACSLKNNTHHVVRWSWDCL